MMAPMSAQAYSAKRGPESGLGEKYSSAGPVWENFRKRTMQNTAPQKYSPHCSKNTKTFMLVPSDFMS